MSDEKNSDGSEFEGGGAQIRREDSAAIEACSRRQLPLVDLYAPIVPACRVQDITDLRPIPCDASFTNANSAPLNCNARET